MLPAFCFLGSASAKRRIGALGFLLAAISTESLLLVPCVYGSACLSSREGFIVRGWIDWELGIFDEDGSVSVGLVSLSAGMGRVVTIWVTSFEKNFSSVCSHFSD